MAAKSKRVAIFGSTGSIGRSALEVIEGSAGRLKVVALSAQSRLAELVEQARRHRPQWVVATDAKAAAAFDWKGLPKDCELLTGPEALVQVAGESDVDVVLAAIVGSAGLEAPGPPSSPGRPSPWPTKRRWSWRATGRGPRP